MIKLKEDVSYNIIIVGVGGTGSHLTSFLAQLIGNNANFKRKHNIILVDEDTVEEKNLRTQKFLESDVGMNKAEVLSDRYSSVFDLNIKYVDKFISNKDDIVKLTRQHHFLTMHNIIVSCVDNNAARKVLDDFFNDNEMTMYCGELIYIDAGNSSGADELTGQAVVGYRNNRKVILPSVSTYFPQMLKEEPEVISTASCGEEMLHNIQNIGANITSACTIFNILNNIIGFNQIPGDLFMFNATNVESESLKINIHADVEEVFVA